NPSLSGHAGACVWGELTLGLRPDARAERDKRFVSSKEICLQIYESSWSEPVGCWVGAQREMILPQEIVLAGIAGRSAVEQNANGFPRPQQSNLACVALWRANLPSTLLLS